MAACPMARAVSTGRIPGPPSQWSTRISQPGREASWRSAISVKNDWREGRAGVRRELRGKSHRVWRSRKTGLRGAPGVALALCSAAQTGIGHWPVCLLHRLSVLMFMFERALTGSRKYWLWVASLLFVVLAVSLLCPATDAWSGRHRTQPRCELGLYIAQFTFFVGVAASAVIVVLPYYCTTISNLSASLSSANFWRSRRSRCACFHLRRLGPASRIFNIVLHPS